MPAGCQQDASPRRYRLGEDEAGFLMEWAEVPDTDHAARPDNEIATPAGIGARGESAEIRDYTFTHSGPDLDPRYAQLRRQAPVARFRFPDGSEGWVVTGYEPARIVQSDPVFSRAAALSRMPAGIRSKSHLIMMDPPEHTRLRRNVAKAFSARRIKTLRPRVREIAVELLDSMAAHGPGADLVEFFSQPLPVTVICELLGVPLADRGRFLDIVDRHQATTAHSPEEVQRAKRDLEDYFAELIATRRREPADDLLSALTLARDVDGTLSEEELVDMGVFLLNAGHLTTVSALTGLRT
jgi:cytochrome P450